MTAALQMALLWGLVTLGSESVRKAHEAGDQAVAEEMERIFREVLLPLVDVPTGKKGTDGEHRFSALTPSEKRLLLAVQKNPNIPARDLPRVAGISLAMLTLTRKELVDKGLLVVETSPGRGHRTVCRLTSAGEKALKNLSEETGVMPPPTENIGLKLQGNGSLPELLSPQLQAVLRAVKASPHATSGYLQRTTRSSGRNLRASREALASLGLITVKEVPTSSKGRPQIICELTPAGEQLLRERDPVTAPQT